MEKIEDAIQAFCKKKRLKCQRNENSIFINFKKLSETFIDDLKEFIINTTEITKKKLKKLMSLLIVRDRVYVLFKTNLYCY